MPAKIESTEVMAEVSKDLLSNYLIRPAAGRIVAPFPENLSKATEKDVSESKTEDSDKQATKKDEKNYY